MPVSTLPCPSRFSGLSRLVVDSTTRPLYHPQTIFKPTLNHLPTNIHRPIPNFILGLPFCLEFGLFRLHSRLKRFLVLAGYRRIAECSHHNNNAVCLNVPV